jgi:hypothetical protein
MSNLQMQLPYTIAENITVTKEEQQKIKAMDSVKLIPLIDSENPETTEKYLGNSLRALRKYPVAVDFCCNMINWGKQTARKNKKDISFYIRDYSRDYYVMKIYPSLFNSYFNECDERTTRNLKGQLNFKQYKGFILIRLERGRGLSPLYTEDFIYRLKPYYYNNTAKKVRYYELFLLKAIFQILVEGSGRDKFKGDGYIKIPEKFYAQCESANNIELLNDKGELYSCPLPTANPIYKTQIFALTHRNPKEDMFEVNVKKFIQNVAPEFLDKNGYIRGRVNLWAMIKSINKSLKILCDNNRNTELVKRVHEPGWGDKLGIVLNYDRKYPKLK